MIKTTPTGYDLEQQLDNILSFVTQPGDTNSSPENDSSQQSTLNKALYYLKNNQPALAAKWMRLSAMSGDRGQFYLGLFFVKGQGVPQSVFHGVAWLSLSSSQGHEPATVALADLRKYIETKRFKDAQCYAASLYEQIHQLQYAHLIPPAP